MIRISDTAQSHFAKLLTKQVSGTQIRIFVINPGTANAECGVSYCPPDAVEPNDTIIKFEKFIAYIDELSVPYLKDAEIDFISNQLDSQLTIKAPNAKVCKVSDTSSLKDLVTYFLNSKINSQLAKHGGYISLVAITDDKYAIVQFGGGCNGCSMINVTFKEWIEKELLHTFPALKGIKDFTKHHHGKHSYY